MSDSSGPQRLLRHRGLVRAVARGLVTDASLVDDVEQETWLVALRGAPRREASTASWLAGIVRNVVRGLRRSDDRRRRREERVAREDRVVGAAEAAAAREVEALVWEALGELSHERRRALVLRYVEGLPPRDISAALGVPVETVRSRLRRGRAELRARLGRRLGRDRRAWSLVGPLATPRASTGGGWTTAKGALAMTAKSKLTGVGALLLLAAGAATWCVSQPTEPSAVPSSAGVDVAADDRSRRPRRARARSATAPAATQDAPSRDGSATDPPPRRESQVSDRSPAPPADDRWRVRVRDAEGEVVPGAVVEVLAVPVLRGYGDSAELQLQVAREAVVTDELRTDASGEFTLPRDGAAPDTRVRLRVHGPNGRTRLATVRPAMGPREITLPGDEEVRGRVVDELGVPVSGLRVFVVDAGAPPAPILTATTSADGRFRLPTLGPDPRPVWVAWPGGLPARAASAVLDGSERLDVEIAVGGLVEGRVVDEVTRGPLEGVRILALGPDGYRGAAFTDPDGRYRIPLLGPGPVRRLMAAKEGYSELHHRDGKFDVERGAAAVRDFALYRGGEVVGFVRGTAGPVAGAVVEVWVRDPTGFVSHRRGESDREGHFRVEGVRPGPGLVKVSRPGWVHPGFPDSREMFQELADGTLDPRCSVTVVDGEPVRLDVRLEPTGNGRAR